MNWNDLEKTWAGQSLPAAAAIDLTQLRRTFEAQSRRLARTLFWRNVREAGAGAFVAVSIAYSALRLPAMAWLSWLAMALVIGVTVFFLWEMARARRNRLGPDASLLAKLDGDIAELRHQRRLLVNVGTWYLAPLFASMIAQKLARTLSTRTLESVLQDSRALTGFVISSLFYAAVCWGVWVYNRRAVRKKIEPQLQELENLRHNLTSS